jgi:hypothetical protein
MLSRVEYRNEKGSFHREDGPAVEYSDGTKEWFINGLRHREDGPAVEYNGGKWWCLNDIEYTEEEFNQELIKIKLKRLVEL